MCSAVIDLLVTQSVREKLTERGEHFSTGAEALVDSPARSLVTQRAYLMKCAEDRIGRTKLHSFVTNTQLLM